MKPSDVTSMLKDENELIRLLVVDDDEVDRKAIRRWIQERDLPYVEHEAASLREATALLKERQFDVVLLDYHLPDGTGLASLPEFLKADVQVVFLTGHGSELVAVNALRDGASDYVVKDANRVYLHFLESTIQNVVARHRAEVERMRLVEELRVALKQVETLRGIIPICCMCKKIRADDGFWQDVEVYVHEHSLADFSHGYCPDCAGEVRDEVDARNANK